MGSGLETRRATERQLAPRRLLIRFARSQQALNDSRHPASLLCDLGFLLLYELTGWLIAVEAAEDLHRYAPVGGAAAVLEHNIEQDRTALLRDRFHALSHEGADKPAA